MLLMISFLAVQNDTRTVDDSTKTNAECEQNLTETQKNVEILKSCKGCFFCIKPVVFVSFFQFLDN